MEKRFGKVREPETVPAVVAARGYTLSGLLRLWAAVRNTSGGNAPRKKKTKFF